MVLLLPIMMKRTYSLRSQKSYQKSKQTADKYLPSVREGVATNETDPALSPRGYWTKLANWLARSRPTLYEFSVQEVRK